MSHYSLMHARDRGAAPACAYSVEDVRAAERLAMAEVGPDVLMQRAAAGLARETMSELRRVSHRLCGSRLLLLVGSGNNGGDTLFAGAALARRGVVVTALPVGRGGLDACHTAGRAALARSGGRLLELDGGPDELTASVIELISGADVIVDGVLGIGGHGALRGLAAHVAALAGQAQGTVIATDLPSGVDADTGAVVDATAVIHADVTVTFGCLKPGLVVGPGAYAAGQVRLVDIGLVRYLTAAPAALVMDRHGAASWLPVPGTLDDKYSRGVVGVVAGSAYYPGAGILCTGSARLGGTGMVRYAGSAGEVVVARWPDVVPHPAGPDTAGRVEAWVFGPGAGTDARTRDQLRFVLDTTLPVLIDADGLTLLATSDDLRERVLRRGAEGIVTVLTPHEGEFARLGFAVGDDRLGAVRSAAREMACVILLKGAATLVAEPAGTAWVSPVSSPALATAGSGDVLSGLAGSMLAANAASRFDLVGAAGIAGAAAFVHGRAGEMAGAAGGPVTAADVLDAVGHAIAEVRR